MLVDLLVASLVSSDSWRVALTGNRLESPWEKTMENRMENSKENTSAILRVSWWV